MAEQAPTAARPVSPNDPDHPDHPHGSMMAVIVVVLLVVLGGAIGYVVYKHQKKTPARATPPITVSTTNVVSGNIDELVWSLGTVTPVYTAMVSARVDGQLVKVNYTEGQMVTTNDLLAEIDPAPYQASLAQAQGQLARDQAQLEGANVDLQRFEDAYGKGYGTNLHAVPKQQVDDQRALVHQYEGAVKLDAGMVSNAQVQLNYCSIHAPFAGRAGLRLVDPGNIIHAANTNALVVIAQLQPITVVFSIDQKYLPAIQRQLKAGHKMVVEAYDTVQSNKIASGTFLTMDSMIDTSTETIKIKALFDNADLALFPNQFVNPKLIIDTLSDVTLVPTASVQRSPQGAFLYVVTNGEVTVTNQSGTTTTNQAFVSMREITPGITDADIEAVEGVDPGEVIVTDNFNKLGDGMKINARQRAAEGEKGGPPGGKKRGGKKDKDPSKSSAP